jgi:2-phospho-L-lactate guanylyltransferase
MMADRIVAVVPVKAIAAAKSRLAASFPPAFRQALARAMLADVLGALAGVSALAATIVVTADAEAASIARGFAAGVSDEAADVGHTGAVMAMARRLTREGRGGLLTLPGDVPGVRVDEISLLIDRHGDAPAFSIVPAHDRRGSNAILMTPPDAVPLAFGNDSFLPHLAAARRCGLEPNVLVLPGLGLDIDNPADLTRFLAAAPPSRTLTFLRDALPAHGPADQCSIDRGMV